MEGNAEKAVPSGNASTRASVSPAAAARRALRRRRRVYFEFYEQFDALVGLLCLSAHEGVKSGHEEEYHERRSFFVRRYAILKPTLQAHLAADADDTYPARHGTLPCDAFEALFLPASIAAMLAADGGNLIGRLMRTQAALDAWDGELGEEERAQGVGPTPLPSPFRDKKSYRH